MIFFVIFAGKSCCQVTICCLKFVQVLAAATVAMVASLCREGLWRQCTAEREGEGHKRCILLEIKVLLLQL